MTAHRCVFGDGPVSGKTVLVAGGAGAVGYYAVQFAKWGGASVIATVSSPEQAEMVRAAGADHTVDRTAEDVRARVLEITGGTASAGVDRIVEVAFGVNLATDAAVLAPGGVIAAYASDADQEPRVPFYPLLVKDATVHFVLVYVMPKFWWLAAGRRALRFPVEALGGQSVEPGCAGDETAEPC